MKTLVVVEHNNDSVKQTTYSTVTAASKISEEVFALILGHNLTTAIDELKKCNHLKKIYFIDKEDLSKPLAENFCEEIIKFLRDNDFTHVFTPSSTFGKNLSPKIATELDVQQVSDIINIIDGNTFERPIYAGNAIARVKSNDPVKVVTVRSTCFEPCKLDSQVDVENISSELSKNELVNFVNYDESKSDRPALSLAGHSIHPGLRIGEE